MKKRSGRATPPRSPARPRRKESPARRSPSRKSPSRRAPKSPKSPTRVPKVELEPVAVSNGKRAARRSRAAAPAAAATPPPAEPARTRSRAQEEFRALERLARATRLPRESISVDKIERDASDDEGSPPPPPLPPARRLATPLPPQTPAPPGDADADAAGYCELALWLVAPALVLGAAAFPLSPPAPPSQRALALVVALWALVALTARFRASIALVAVAIATAVCEAKSFSPSSTVREEFWQVGALNALAGATLSFALCAFGERRGASWPTRLLRGPSETPEFGGAPLQIFVHRIGHVGFIMVNALFIYNGLTVSKLPGLSSRDPYDLEFYLELIGAIRVSPTLVVFSTMQILYALGFLYCEDYAKWSFDFKNEGCGHIFIIGYSLYPFFVPLITHRVLKESIVLPNLLLLCSSAVYLIGLYVMLKSNWEKNLFRDNPNHPKIAYLQSLPTLQGNRLIVSGWWGFVRHPNYLGDILIHLSYVAVAYDSLALINLLITFVVLVHRVKRDGDKCSERYNVAWKRYCHKVPYALLPRIY